MSVAKAPGVFTPESSDYEKYEELKNAVKNRDEYSSSPADSQSGRSITSSHRKSVSFDLDVEEYTPDYTPIDHDFENARFEKFSDEDIFYEKSHYHHQQLQPEPKRIKGILRSSSPNVYYKGNVHSRVAVEKEFIEDDDGENEENPFRKEFLSGAASSVISESDPSDVRYHVARQSFENLSGGATASKIPIKKTIFKATGSLVDRPKIAPPRPPQPAIKVAEMVKNEGLERMSQHMEQNDFLEFVHNAETNTVQEVKGQELFDPDDPLPPLPKCPPPSLLPFKRGNSLDRPKDSPPPPPTPKMTEEILEILPARFDTFPMKQKPHFVNENSQNNILVSEDEHREILLTENEMRNAMITAEYEDCIKDKTELLIRSFSSTNPFLDDAASSSFDSNSFQSTPSVLSPVSTLDKSSSSFGNYVPTPSSHVPSINNIFPPPTQILPVHYGQLPKPQQAGYYPLVSTQYPLHYHATPSTGIPVSQAEYRRQQQQQLQQQSAFLVSGDGQNNFYVTHNVNNTANNQQLQQQQTLLMQSAYEPLSQPSPPNQHSSHQHPLQMHMQASNSQYVATSGTPPANNNQPQFIYEQQIQQPQYYHNNLRNNNVQYVTQHQQFQQSSFVETPSELSPIRINAVPQNFVYPSTSKGEQNPSMSSFGKQTEV